MQLSELNRLAPVEASALFSQCCSASRWVYLMVSAMPYSSIESIHDAAREHWKAMAVSDYMQAFDGHPKIGDPESLREKYRSTHAMATDEQSAVKLATDQVLAELAQYNARYEKKFGYIFIVCVTGKSAAEMLALIRSRIKNAPEEELNHAAREQAKITAVRINKLFADTVSHIQHP